MCRERGIMLRCQGQQFSFGMSQTTSEQVTLSSSNGLNSDSLDGATMMHSTSPQNRDKSNKKEEFSADMGQTAVHRGEHNYVVVINYLT